MTTKQIDYKLADCARTMWFAAHGWKVEIYTHDGLRLTASTTFASWDWARYDYRIALPTIPEGWRLVEMGEGLKVGQCIRYLKANDKEWGEEQQVSGWSWGISGMIDYFILTPIEPAKPKLQLREGAYYKRRDGKIVGPCEGRTYRKSYLWAVGGLFYNNQGTYFGNGEEHNYDLIEEVSAPEPKILCHARGEVCLGCDHYWGKAPVCQYAPEPKRLPLRKEDWDGYPVWWLRRGNYDKLVTGITHDSVYCGNKRHFFTDLAMHYQRSHDRKEWQKCERVEV